LQFTNEINQGDFLTDGTAKQKKRTCPVCDEQVSVDTKVCPSCSTDLSLFSADDSNVDIVDAEELKKTLMSADNDHMSELLQAANNELPPPTKTQPVELVYDESVDCPSCGKSISAVAESCPLCGVKFQVEEVFECPMCKALVDINVNKCPGCGTEFEEESSQEIVPEPEPVQKTAAPAQKPVEPVRKAPPQPEPKLEPVSFVDRLKQIKDEPASPPVKPEPKKELSFAERMKAMKNEKPPEEETPQVPVTTPAPAPAKTPVPEPATKTKSPEPAEPAPLPKKDGGSISDRVKSLRETAPAPQKPAPETAQPAPQQDPKIAPQPIAQPTVQPTPQPPLHSAPPASEDEKRDGYKELPRYIGEVKKLLLLANELKLDVSTSKAMINKAVTAGKTRDLDNAIKLVKEGKAGLERDIRTAMLTKLRTLETALSLEKKAGKNVSLLEHALDDIKKSMEIADFQIASDEMKKLEEQMLSSSTSKISQVELDTISCALIDAESLHLNVSDAKSLYNAAINANAQNDAQKSSMLSKQASESLNKLLPSFIASEMRKAKITLREIKMMNVDITAPVNLLKEANDHVLHGDYCAALGSIKKFKDFISKAQE
jgi:RNA polymerase subunit RPABC4/transcription elongation factor Spt4